MAPSIEKTFFLSNSTSNYVGSSTNDSEPYLCTARETGALNHLISNESVGFCALIHTILKVRLKLGSKFLVDVAQFTSFTSLSSELYTLSLHIERSNVKYSQPYFCWPASNLIGNFIFIWHKLRSKIVNGIDKTHLQHILREIKGECVDF